MKDSFGLKLIVTGTLLLVIEIYGLAFLRTLERIALMRIIYMREILTNPFVIASLLLTVVLILVGIICIIKEKNSK